MVVSISSANLSSHPVFAHGAFTSADRDVRRYAIQKAMRAIDLGAELGAELHELSGAGETDRVDRRQAAAGRPRPLPRGGRLPVRVRRASRGTRRGSPCGPTRTTRQGDSLLPTIGHALAFVGTLDRPEMVGLGPVIAHASAVTAGGCHGVALAIDAASSSTSASTPSPPATTSTGRRSGRPACAMSSCSSSCSRSPATTARCTSTSIRAASTTPPRCGTSPLVACAPTGRSRPRRSGSPTTPRSATPSRPAGRRSWREPSVGPFSAEAGRALSTERFDPAELLQRRYRDQRLDQLVIDLVLGLR